MNSLEISELNLNLIQLYRSHRRVADVATAATENTLPSPTLSATRTLMPAVRGRIRVQKLSETVFRITE